MVNTLNILVMFNHEWFTNVYNLIYYISDIHLEQVWINLHKIYPYLSA